MSGERKCQATWWHREEKAGQRVKVHHVCGRRAGHDGWHTCQFHTPTDRMARGAVRVTERSADG